MRLLYTRRRPLYEALAQLARLGRVREQHILRHFVAQWHCGYNVVHNDHQLFHELRESSELTNKEILRETGSEGTGMGAVRNKGSILETILFNKMSNSD